MNEESFSGGEDHLKELIRDTNERFIREDLTKFLKIPSYTSNKKGIGEAKSFLMDYISGFCEEVKEIKGEKNPLLLAKVDGELKEKLLIYGMYDTQPVSKEKEWLKKPFGAEIADLPRPLDNLGKVIIARGAYNSKTPLLCFLNIVKHLKEQGKLPMSLLILIDGEEEQGSPTLIDTLNTKKQIFNKCIDAYYPSLKQDLKGTSVLKLGYKGILSLNIKASSSNAESHSSFSSMIPNPAQDLILVLNEIYSEKKYKIKSLSAPYKMTKREIEIMDKLMESIDLEIIKEKAGIKLTLIDDPKQSFIEYLFNPTFNISTLKSGYLEDGVKNIVANKAECNIDIRFAHNTSTKVILDEIKEKVRELKRKLKSKFEITHSIGYNRSKVKENTILVKSLTDSFKMLGVPTQVWPISAAAAPLSQIQSHMGFNFIVGGLGVGGYAHSPNEFVQLNSIQNTRLSNYIFLDNYRNNLVRMKKSAESS